MLGKQKSLFKIVLDASMVGIQLVFATVIGFAIGYLLDTKVFKTFPWLTIIFFILGLVAGFRDLVRMAIKSTKTENESDKKGQ
ncbi:MAG: AtpZ/AtpI family protein [Nitrospirota bacterium]|nr:AtpZ/AtpI family protein [Nitrospirota bacterium]MDH5767567.1 AtpZ/AtpI family protein [Nitrospirota bacterium]